MTELAAILSKWDGAKYSKQCFARYRHCNCLQFVCAVMDEWHGFPEERFGEVPTLPAATAIHNRREALRCHAFAAKRYPHRILHRHRQECSLEEADLVPGDCISVLNSANPGHTLIVGPERRVWHSMTNVGVCRTSFAWCKGCGIYRIYRPLLAEQQHVLVG